jgi:hypothetical protein
MSQGLTDIKLKNTEAFLKAYMERLETLAKIEIDKNRQRTYPSGRTVNSPLNSSGSLRDSIESKKQEVSNALMAFGLMGNDYALDINSGTPKSKAPSEAKLVNWIKAKPVQLRNKKGKIIKKTEGSIKAIAKRIQNSQKINGIAPVPFLEEAAKDSMSHLNGIGLEIAYDITENVEQFLINIGYEEVNGEFKLKEKNNE